MGKRGAKPASRKWEQVETELRLVGTPDVLQAVFASSLVMPANGQKETVVDLESRYFDTPKQDLRARGLAFRVRADGVGFRQTLKAGDDVQAALLKRDEWEMALENARPRPDALPKDARKRLPKAVFEAGLEQAFTTKVRRRVRKVRIAGIDQPAAQIEAALDLGEIETGAERLPIAEIELELLEGSPGALYRLAHELQKIGPLYLETRSKSARAFDRLADKPPSWHRATTSPISRADDVDEAMAAIFDSCFQQWLANQAAAIDGRDPEGVHQMRVALRRLRSALSVFRKVIPPNQLAWLQVEAKHAIGALGPARDWDVFEADLLAPVIEARPDDPDLAAIGARARARRNAGYRRARKHLESAAYTRFVLQFGQWLEQRSWRGKGDAKRAALQAQPILEFASKLLSKRQEQTRSKGRHFASLAAKERHELRLALKKLRYTVEFFRPVFDKNAVKPFLRSVKTLQQDLGHLNDVAVAETLMAELLARPGKHDIRVAAGLVIGWHARGVAAVEPDLRRAWRVFAAQPTFWRS